VWRQRNGGKALPAGLPDIHSVDLARRNPRAGWLAGEFTVNVAISK
jgi:hypothetical protein